MDRRQREGSEAERFLRRGIVEVALEPGCRSVFVKVRKTAVSAHVLSPLADRCRNVPESLSDK